MILGIFLKFSMVVWGKKIMENIWMYVSVKQNPSMMDFFAPFPYLPDLPTYLIYLTDLSNWPSYQTFLPDKIEIFNSSYLN